MAVTESRPAPHDGEPPPADGPDRARRHPWRRRILMGLGLLLATAVVVLAVLAGTYQPIRFGDTYGGDFPGLPQARGLGASIPSPARPGRSTSRRSPARSA